MRRPVKLTNFCSLTKKKKNEYTAFALSHKTYSNGSSPNTLPSTIKFSAPLHRTPLKSHLHPHYFHFPLFPISLGPTKTRPFPLHSTETTANWQIFSLLIQHLSNIQQVDHSLPEILSSLGFQETIILISHLTGSHLSIFFDGLSFSSKSLNAGKPRA